MPAGGPRPLPGLLVLLVVLGACAAPARSLRPEDFPSHAGVAPGFGLHWRLDREAGRAVADGGVSVWAPDQIQDVTVELVGLDRDGRVVSRAWDIATPRSFQGKDLWPFTIRLRLRGSEERFAVRVADYRLKNFRADP